MISCLTEERGGRLHEEGITDVRFSIDVPDDMATPTSTRALPYSDKAIENVDLLVFDASGDLVEHVVADDIVVNAATSQWQFTARLSISDESRTIYLVANGRDPLTDAERVNFSDFSIGMNEWDVIPYLQTASLSSPVDVLDLLPMVMWGKASLSEVSSNQIISGVKLLRVAASISVREGTATNNNGLNDFYITKFSIHNGTEWGMVAPSNWDSWNSLTPSWTNDMDVPAGTDHFSSSSSGYWSDPGDKHFLYERDTPYDDPSDYTSVIISAIYKGAQCFYKVRLMDPVMELPIAFVRNHHYILTIESVSTSGYPTLEAAIDGPPSNGISIDLLDVNEQLTCFVANGTNYIGVSNNKVTIQGLNRNNTLELALVYISSPQWVIRWTGTGLENVGFDEWNITPEGLMPLTANLTGTAGSAVITVTDEELEIDIEVTINGISTGAVGAKGGNGYNIVSPTFMTAANSPWHARILPNQWTTRNVYLHTAETVNGAPSPGNAMMGSWGATSVSSSDPYVAYNGSPAILPYPKSLNLFFGTSAYWTQSAVGIVEYSRVENNDFVVGRYIINGGDIYLNE